MYTVYVYVHMCIPFRFSISLFKSVYLTVSHSLFMLIYPSLCLCSSLSLCLSQYIYIYIYMRVCARVCVCVCVCVCV